MHNLHLNPSSSADGGAPEYTLIVDERYLDGVFDLESKEDCEQRYKDYYNGCLGFTISHVRFLQR